MLRKLFLLITIFIVVHAFAQDGFYFTSADLKNGKFMATDANTLKWSEARGGTIDYKINGVKKTVKFSEVFAIRWKAVLYRTWDGRLFSIDRAGYFYYWHYGVGGDHGMSYDVFALSEGIDGPLFKVGSLNGLKELADKHPEFASVYNCTSSQIEAQAKDKKPKGHGGGDTYGFIQNCLAKPN